MHYTLLRRRIRTYVYPLIVFLAVMTAAVAPAWGLTMSGKIYTIDGRAPVEFGSVLIVEAKMRAITRTDGSYRLTIAEPGEYTIKITAAGMKPYQGRIRIAGDLTRDFYLSSTRLGGMGITVTGERDIQKAARYTMTVKELKEVPASFGDSVSALTALPGVIRTDAFFGPLVIRGMSPDANKYYIDEIPVYSPLHFGGLHSVINNNLMSEIDLYASAFPAQYGSASGAVISINTLDDVKQFGGYTDMGLISASALIKAPIVRRRNGEVLFLPPGVTAKKDDETYTGYVIASGRIGYLSVFFPPIYKILTGDTVTSVPEYWDYQVKVKYMAGKEHTFTALFLGSRDYFTFIEKEELEASDDPLFQNMEFKTDKQVHGQGLYYTWRPSDGFQNRLIAYSSLTDTYTYYNLPNSSSDVWKDLNILSRPWIFGIKDRLKIDVIKDHLELRGGPEYTYYYFVDRGKTLISRMANVTFDPNDPDQFATVYLDDRIINHVLGGYAEMKLTLGGFTFLPGIRSDYLYRSGETTFDPRGVMSYEFSTGTTLSVAGGHYSYFTQVNPNTFDILPYVAEIGEELRSEKAIHRTASVEQRLDPFSIKMEGFFNNFYDIAYGYPYTDPEGGSHLGLPSGKLKTYGFELMIKKDIRENENGLYGWINYTYAISRVKSGLPTEDGYLGVADNDMGDPYGDRYVTFEFEQRHTLKLVAGYQYKRHTLGARFQYYSPMPATPITGAIRDDDYSNTHPNERWVPTYGTPNSKHFAPSHRLDLRWSYKINHAWGYVSWYIEVINVYNYKARSTEQWDYRYPYGENNPRTTSSDEELGVIPNFGVEVKF